MPTDDSSPFSVAALVFAKAPEPGAVKTRLAPLLGDGGAAVLAARLARRTIGVVTKASFASTTLCCAPDETHAFFALCERQFAATLVGQGDGDLGARMHRAFVRALTRHDAAVLVGTDIPAMDPSDLDAAGAALRAGADAVLGPASDGGYWLIGLRRPDVSVFEGIEWSAPSVLAATRERMTRLGWRVAEVPTRADVDRPEDVARLAADGATAALVSDLLAAASRSRTSNGRGSP